MPQPWERQPSELAKHYALFERWLEMGEPTLLVLAGDTGYSHDAIRKLYQRRAWKARAAARSSYVRAEALEEVRERMKDDARKRYEEAMAVLAKVGPTLADVSPDASERDRAAVYRAALDGAKHWGDVLAPADAWTDDEPMPDGVTPIAAIRQWLAERRGKGEGERGAATG